MMWSRYLALEAIDLATEADAMGTPEEIVAMLWARYVPGELHERVAVALEVERLLEEWAWAEVVERRAA